MLCLKNNNNSNPTFKDDKMKLSQIYEIQQKTFNGGVKKYARIR